MNKFIKVIFLLFISKCYAGVGLEATRIIYDENKASTSLVAFNNSENVNYLIQSWVEDEYGNVVDDFIITPPIQKINGMSKNSIDVVKVKPLAGKEEKLYWANFKFIPPVDKNGESQLAITVAHRIKLIHRPDGLKKTNFKEVMSKVTTKRSGGYIYIKNNTGVYINIAYLTQSAKSLEKISYIKPNSEIKIKLINKNKVILSYIDDLGAISPVEL